MFFTQDDYKKIQEWLQRNSVKDTEFQEADIPLNGNEIITLTQNSHSRKVYLKDLVEQMFSIGIADFVNVSSLHDKYNITLNEAIQLVPHKSRKKGQVITFCNTDNVWKIYQFTGVKNQWNILDLWNDVFDWTTILDVNFGPDEEDITANKNEDNIKLSFKDRVYEPASHSGLGYKILRKNIVAYNDPVQGELTKNILVQDKVAQSNTIYEIRYDFDLNNQTINIPENSVLQYKGGSLNNGKIVYNNTIIEGIEKLNNVTTEGNYTYPYTGDVTNPDEQLAPTLAQLKKLSTEVTNIADDEDLTKIYDSEKGQEVLQLKDRQYVQGSNSGMGYVILRQNKSFKEQVTKANTIYEIRYDFDLGGEEVEIPENCVLKFDGGSLGNGTIVGQATKISCRETDIFRSILLAGKWIGAVSDLWFAYRLDSYAHFNIVSSLFKFEQINIYRKYYYLEKWLAINISNSNVSVYGHGVNLVLPANKGETTEGYGGYHEYKIPSLFVTDAQDTDTLYVTDVNIVDNQNVISGWGENVDAEKIIRLNIFTASYKTITFDNVSYDGTGELLHIWTSKQCNKISINNCRVTTSEFAYEIGTVNEGKLEKVEFNNCVIIGRSNAPWVGHVSLVRNTIPEVIFNNCEIYSAVIGNLETMAVQSLTITNCRFTNQWVSSEKDENMNVLNIHNSTFIQTKVSKLRDNTYKFYAKRLNITNNTIISEYGRIEQIERAEEIFFCNNTMVYKGESPRDYKTILAFVTDNDRVYFIGNKFYNSTQPQGDYRPYLRLPLKYMVHKDNTYDNWNISTSTKNMYSTNWTYMTGSSPTQTNGLAEGGQTIVPKIEQPDADCYTVEMLCVVKHLDSVGLTLGAFTIGEQTITLECSYGTLRIKVGDNGVASNSVVNCLVSKGIHQDIQFTTVIYKEGDNTSVLVSINGNEVMYAKTDIPWALPSITINTTDMLPLRAYRCYMGGIIKDGVVSSNTPYENTRIGVPLSGIVLESTKAKRPYTGRLNGQSWFDTTLGKPIWWTGSKWVDATGADV